MRKNSSLVINVMNYLIVLLFLAVKTDTFFNVTRLKFIITSESSTKYLIRNKLKSSVCKVSTS